jgi:hypothetical protein
MEMLSETAAAEICKLFEDGSSNSYLEIKQNMAKKYNAMIEELNIN